MTCLFCQSKCQSYIFGSRCDDCRTEFYYEGDLAWGCMRLEGGDYYDNSIPYLRFNLPPFKPYARIVASSTVYATWNYMPNINPTNLKEKIKLYLLFS